MVEKRRFLSLPSTIWIHVDIMRRLLIMMGMGMGMVVKQGQSNKVGKKA